MTLKFQTFEDEHQAVFVGDGIDGAPALTAFTVGLAFGQNSDVTAEAARGVVLEARLRRVGEGAPAADHLRPEVVVAGSGGCRVSRRSMNYATEARCKTTHANRTGERR